jgi:hypothetical protein
MAAHHGAIQATMYIDSTPDEHAKKCFHCHQLTAKTMEQVD